MGERGEEWRVEMSFSLKWGIELRRGADMGC